ncbi:MAG: hypothetical protein E7471_02215 [Ruminococcaceae bacterium]|nr:hypothetical protein [Oscillospiraceae bacterium]
MGVIGLRWSYVRVTALVLLLFAALFEPTLKFSHVFSERVDRDCAVLLDPGHGGIDGGAVGKNGTVEKGINLAIAEKTAALLGLFGVSNALTRDGDYLLSSEFDTTIRSRKNADLKNRVKLANSMRRASFISVHLNSYQGESCHGAQVFYSPNQDDSKRLAKLLQSEMVSNLDKENHRVAKTAEHGHYLLQHIQCPAVLVECGFLSNYREEAMLSDDDYQTKIAGCIVNAYLKYNR